MRAKRLLARYRRVIRLMVVFALVGAFATISVSAVTSYKLFGGDEIYDYMQEERLQQSIYVYNSSGDLVQTTRYNVSGLIDYSGQYLTYRLYVPSRINTTAHRIEYTVPFARTAILDGYMTHITLNRTAMMIPFGQVLAVTANFTDDDGNVLTSPCNLPDLIGEDEDGNGTYEYYYSTSEDLTAPIPNGATTFESITITFNGFTSVWNNGNVDGSVGTDWYVGTYGIYYQAEDGYNPALAQLADDINQLVNMTPEPVTPTPEVNPSEDLLQDNLTNLWEENDWLEWDPTYGYIGDATENTFVYIFNQYRSLAGISTLIGLFALLVIYKAVI